MQKKSIHIRVTNGLTFRHFLDDIVSCNGLGEWYNFIESEDPEFILFGPYGNQLPPKGDYTRIGYFCENIWPDLKICEWAFGVPAEEKIDNPKYKRIQWHGTNPKDLLKKLTDNDIDAICSSHNRFCNFLYSNPVPYREEFFRQLSKYKRIDAPGRSMHNMASIDVTYPGSVWERKKKFLSQYKFTIAFENYSFPGYQTEKLYDPMLMQSLPVYCGDPTVGAIFNTDSFLNIPDYIPLNDSFLVRLIEDLAEPNFRDIRPQFFKTPPDRIRRRCKADLRKVKMSRQFNRLDFSNVIDRIIEIDKDPALYKKYLIEPWLREDAGDLTNSVQWRKIFG